MEYPIRQFPKRCSNYHNMGNKQKDFEDYLIKEYQKHNPLTPELQRQITVQALNFFGFKKICCLTSYYNARICIVCDANKVVFTDNLGISVNKENLKTKIELPGPEYIPKRKIPNFPS